MFFFSFFLVSVLGQSITKNTLSEFHQEVALNQYFYLHQEFFFFFFWCLDYPRINGQIFIKNFVGRTWPKEEIINFWERSGSYFRYKKS